MSRLFDGTDDQMVYGSVSGFNTNGAITTLAVVKVAITTDNTWLSFIEGETSGGGSAFGFGRRPDHTGGFYWSNPSAAGFCALQIHDSHGWCVTAVTKATGTATPRAHRCATDAVSNNHTDFTGTMGNGGSITSGTLRIGGNDDFANIRVAAAAIFDVALSDADIEGIASAKTTQSILDLSPAWCVDDSDGFATDLVGSIDRTAITGTADDADDPSGWEYFGEGGGEVTVVRSRLLIGGVG